MNLLYEEHRLILKTLLEYQVQFILIGGYAVNYYGYNRVTGDMDIWIKPDNQNKEFLLKALTSIGFDDDGIATLKSWDFTLVQKFHVGITNQPDKTEFMTHISGVSYAHAEKNQRIVEIQGIQLPLIHYRDLIINKKASGRLKDLSDVEHLEKIQRLKKDPL